MFSRINSYGIQGVDGFAVSVEVDISDGLPNFTMVGYLAREVGEAQERVRTGLKNAGFRLPPRKVTVNLAPAGVRKEGTGYDLAVAAGVLCSMGEGEAEPFAQSAFVGEIGLDGGVKPVSGVLPRVYTASKQGIRRFFVPSANVEEGRVVQGVEIVGVTHVKELASFLHQPDVIRGSFFSSELFTPEAGTVSDLDYSQLNGLPTVRRASEAAAAGRHNILYIGPAGTGKTMAARRLPTILPPLTLEESLEISKIYSICGLLKPEQPLVTKRPFRSPHHSVTASALAGGGRNPRPGEISLASKGILFLDELAEFSPQILDLLREPMEEGWITVSRMGGAVEFPADAMVAAAMNPCKCGFFPDRARCRCSQQQLRRYLGRISAPLLDRFDLGVEVPRQTADEGGDSSAVMRERVMFAVERQERRFGVAKGRGDGAMVGREASGEKTVDEKTVGEKMAVGGTRFNSQMNGQEIHAFCRLEPEDEAFLLQIQKREGFSIRGRDKILKAARTLADLDGKDGIGREQLCEAIAFRGFERKYWGWERYMI